MPEPVLNPPVLRFDMNLGEELPFTVVGNYTLRFGNYLIEIPDGFATDLASVPLWMLWGFSPTGKHQVAALVHDKLYRSKELPKIVADGIFLAMLEHSGVGAKRYAMYWAVRIFGGPAWRRKK